MKRFRDRKTLKLLLTTVMAAVMTVNIAACNGAGAGETLDTITPVSNDVEQSAATTVMLETVSSDPTPTNTPTSTPSPSPSLAPEDRVVTVSFTGDCTLAQDYRSGSKAFDKKVNGDMDYCFKNCAEMFKTDDMTLVNLENPVTDQTSHKNNQYVFRMDPNNLEMLTRAGIEAVNIANNHTMDFWEAGLKDTRKNLDDKGILWSDDKYGSIFTTKKGIKIGMVGLGNDTNTSAVTGIIDDLRTQGAVIIIASCHFGAEGVYEPTARQKKIAHELIDYGVDIVVGTHPHRLQPIEKYKGHYIFYSLSNFCFGGNYSLTDPDSVIIQCDFIMDADGSKCVDYRLRVYPYSQTSTRPGNDFCPKPYAWESDDYFRVMKRLEWAQGDE